MLSKPDHYDRLDAIYPQHELHLEVSVQADRTWDVMAFCVDLFRTAPVELKRIAYDADHALSFRLRCADHQCIRHLERAMKTEAELRVLKWVTEIGGSRP